MVPTMQPPAGIWNPDAASIRSNGAGRQAEMFGYPVTGQPFVTHLNNAFQPNPYIQFGTTPNVNPFVSVNPYATVNPFITTNGIGTTPVLNPAVNGLYPTTNPYLAAVAQNAALTGMNTSPFNPTLGSTLVPICTTSIGSIVYRDTITGMCCDSCYGLCGLTVNPITGQTIVTPIQTTMPTTTGFNSVAPTSVLPQIPGINYGIPSSMFNTIPTTGINPFFNTHMGGISPFNTITNPWINQFTTPFGINTIPTNPFHAAMRGISHTPWAASAIYGLNNGVNTIPAYYGTNLTHPYGTHSCGTGGIGFNPTLTPFNNLFNTPYGVTNPWIAGANINTTGFNAYGTPITACGTNPNTCTVC